MGDGYYSSKVIFVWSQGLESNKQGKQIEFMEQIKETKFNENRVFQKYG